MEINNFGNRLKQLFGNATNKAIASQIGASEAAVQTYAKGRVPPADVLIKIAEVTNCDLHWLLTGEGKAAETRASPPLVNRDVFSEMVREIVREELRRGEPIQELGSVDEFDIEAAIDREESPGKILQLWYEHDRLPVPADFIRTASLDNWSGLTRAEKAEQIRAMRSIYERGVERKKIYASTKSKDS